MNKIIAKTYRYLKANSGKDISWNLLMEDLAEKKKDKKHGKKHSGDHKEDLMIFLNFLESELLIEKHKKHVHVSKNFKITGKISLSKWGDGFVKLRSQKEVFVPREFTEGAIPGDTVEIIPLGFGKRGRLEGEVREVIKRGRTFYRLKIVDADEHYFYGIILDQNGEEKEGFLRKKSLLADVVRSIKKDDVLIVKFREDSFQSGNLYETSFLRFEEGDSRDRDYNRILLKYDFHQNYPEEIILNFPETPGPENTEDWGERADLRNLWTATIDGATSKDFDDAVSIETEGDVVRFYVHIADVGHYVRLHTPLDEEALKRATSVYLTDHVVPMLPPVLSEDLCSLVAGKDRLAFTAEMTGDWNGRIHSARFYKSIIKVDRRYTYESAEEEIIKNEEGSRICLLNRLAEGQRKSRMEEGRVDLNLKEVYFSTAEDGSVKEVKIRERLKSHMLIEELMLSANQKTAEFIRRKKAPALFRIHEVMDEDKLETLNSFLKIYGFRNQISSVDYKEIRKVQKAVSGHESERVFNYILLRSFMQAFYGGGKGGHWGLGFTDYCHFTSPIRRYPDLVIHRVLEALIRDEELPYSKDEIVDLGFHTSEEERRAAEAERDMNRLKVCRYIDAAGVKEFTGIIIGIKPQNIFVELENIYGEAVVKHHHFTDETELHLMNEFSFLSKKYSRPFFLGERLKLELEKTDFEEMRIYARPIISEKKK